MYLPCAVEIVIKQKIVITLFRCCGHVTGLPCDSCNSPVCINREKIVSNLLLVNVPSMLLNGYTSRKSGNIFRNTS